MILLLSSQTFEESPIAAYKTATFATTIHLLEVARNVIFMRDISTWGTVDPITICRRGIATMRWCTILSSAAEQSNMGIVTSLKVPSTQSMNCVSDQWGLICRSV